MSQASLIELVSSSCSNVCDFNAGNVCKGRAAGSEDVIMSTMKTNQQCESLLKTIEQQTNCNLTEKLLLSSSTTFDLKAYSNLLSSSSNNQLPLTKFMLNYVHEPAQLIDSNLDYYFSEIWSKNGDERTSKLPFMSGGPWKLVYATLLYLCLIKILFPNLMKNRKAFELNWCIRLYNLLMVFSNLYAFYHGARILRFGLKCFGCEIINSKDYTPSAMELLHYGWLFLLSRLIEWLDTIFFVLRKRDRQVTKLHVFHHSFVPMLCWTYLKFHPGFTVAFFPFVNTFVHTIMYTYYFLATFGTKIQPYLWWKKYLTSLQIAQFVLILIQLASIPLSTNEKCQYPRLFLYVAFAGAILFLCLFYTYYLDTYKSKQQQQKSSTMTTALTTTTSTIVNKQRYRREGSSTGLSDLVDNAIVCEANSTFIRRKLV